MIRKRWVLLPLVALLLLTAGDRMSAQEGASLSVDPASQTVGLEDGAFEVRILVDNVTTNQGLGGYTLVMDYDPNVLHALTITDSGFVASTGNAVVCPASAIDNDAGRLAQFCFTIPIFSQAGPQTTDPQVLARVTFEPVGEGATTLDIGGSTLTDPQGNTTLAPTANGEVTVRLNPTSTAPTATAEAATTAEPAQDTGTVGVLPALGSGPDRDATSPRQYLALGFLALSGFALLGTALLVRRRV